MLHPAVHERLVLALMPLFLAVPKASIVWGLFGLLFIGFLIYSLRTGEIPDAEGLPYTRKEDRFHFNAYLFWGALLVFIFFAVAIAFYIYPNAVGPMIRDELPRDF